MNISIVLVKELDRLYIRCRSWREIRVVIRQWRPAGYKPTRIRRDRWRANWMGDRTFARQALRDLEASHV